MTKLTAWHNNNKNGRRCRPQCFNLPNMDVLSKTDAVVCGYLQDVRPSSAAAEAKRREATFVAGLQLAAGKHDTTLKHILHETAAVPRRPPSSLPPSGSSSRGNRRQQ